MFGLLAAIPVVDKIPPSPPAKVKAMGMDYYEALVINGIMSANEVRALAGLPQQQPSSE